MIIEAGAKEKARKEDFGAPPKHVSQRLQHIAWISCWFVAIFDRSLRFLRADFWEGDATKHFSAKKKGFFSERGGGNSVNGGFGKDFYRKENSVKRSGRFSEPPDSEN